MVTLAALTAVSGFLDAVSYLALGHVFTADMTRANVLLFGFAAAGAAGLLLRRQLLRAPTAICLVPAAP